MYESPDYETIERIDGFELRKYQRFYTVSIQESSLNGYSGFGYLFNYISGNNQHLTKMKMTVPVINELAESEKSMEFVIPKIHQQNIPQPNDTQMKIKDYPEQLVLVYQFSGIVNQDKLDELMIKMDQALVKFEMIRVGKPKIARYNGPYTLPFLRRNEIWLTVRSVDKTDKVHTT